MVGVKMKGLAGRRRLYRGAGMALMALLAALALGACGSDDNGSDSTAASTTSTSGGGGAESVAISETDYKLTPADPSVKAGEVTFDVSNDGQTAHNLEVEGPDGTTDVEVEMDANIDPGQKGQLTVDLSTPGTYEMYCPVDDHKGLGMKGEITVTG